MKFNPHNYQDDAVNFLLNRSRAALFADMGLGKTAIVLSVLHKLMFDYLEVKRPLIIAPLKVAYNVWPNEIEKWFQFQDIPYHILHGKGRVKYPPGLITITNYDTIPWLYRNNCWQQYDCIVYDESTFIKNDKTLRWRATFAMFASVKRQYLLTGTPSPNGLLDLWGQIYFLDNGRRLGHTKTDYKNHWFIPPFKGFKWQPRKGAVQEIADRLSDICLVLRRDLLPDVPDVQYIRTPVSLPADITEAYREAQSTFVTEIKSLTISAFNVGALGNKLRQIASGIIYSSEEKINGRRPYIVLHEEKLLMLKDLIDAQNGEPVLVAVNFRCEAEEIKKRFGGEIIYGGTPIKESKRIIDNWNKGKLNLLIAHPASLSHGVNLQHGGSAIIWFAPPWNLEHWMQFNGRLDRQGQKKKVAINTLVSKGTKDYEVARALSEKGITQDKLLRRIMK